MRRIVVPAVIALCCVLCNSCETRNGPFAPPGEFSIAVVFGAIAQEGNGYTYTEIWAGAPDGRLSRLSFNPACFHRSPSPSPDGGKVVYVTCSDPYGTDLAIVNADGSGLRELTRTPDVEANPLWSPDGVHIAFQSTRNGVSDITVIDSAGTGFIKAVQSNTGDCILGGWSPDGNSILYYRTSGDSTDRTTQIAYNARNGSSTTQVTTGPGEKTSPSWSPQGDRIAFIMDGRIHTILVNGDSTVTVADSPDSVDGPLRWTGDGTTIVFSAHPVGKRDIYHINSRGGELVNLTNSFPGGYDPDVSSDGRQIAYVAIVAGYDKIYLMNMDGTARRPLTYFNANEFHPVWTRH